MKSMLRAVERATPRVWSFERKLLPNVLPLLCGAPFAVLAIALWVKGLQWNSLAVLALGLAAAAVSLNWLGLIGNSAMRRILCARLAPAPDALFVGFSPPTYRGLLDPHEDVGFLEILPDSVTITGELSTVTIRRSRDVSLTYEFNPHSVLGLGRWLAIDGIGPSGPVRINVEPRERPTLRANRRLSAKLRADLDAWRKQ